MTPRGPHYSNQHHCLAQWEYGSDVQGVNLLPVKASRHNAYHSSWGDERRPEVNFRRALTQAIGPEYCPDPDRLETVYQIATMSRWHKLYKPSALVSIACLSNVRRVIETTQLEIVHLQREIALLSNTINALRDEGDFPCKNQNKAMLRFFSTSKNTYAALRMFLDEQHEGKHTWFEALHIRTRKDLRTAVNATALSSTAACNERLQDVLVTQREYLERHLRERKSHLEQWDLPLDRDPTSS